MKLTPKENLQIQRNRSKQLEKEIGKSPFKNKFRTSSLNHGFQTFDAHKLNKPS
jgi:hypothetical protein